MTGDMNHIFTAHYDNRAKEVYFILLIRSAIGAKNVVEPDGGSAVDVRTLPRVPRKIRLRLPGNKAPVEGSNIVFLGDRQRTLKGAAISASHIFGANNGATIRPQPDDAPSELLGLIVAVERNYVRHFNLYLLHRVQFLRRGPAALPNATRQRLSGTRFTHPVEHFREKDENQCDFIRWLQVAVASPVCVIRLVPDVPT